MEVLLELKKSRGKSMERFKLARPIGWYWHDGHPPVFVENQAINDFLDTSTYEQRDGVNVTRYEQAVLIKSAVWSEVKRKIK
jgi:hypothetical protein